MEENKIVIEKAVSVAGLTIIPINRVSISLRSTRAGEAYLAVKQPIAVVVVSPQTKRSFTTTGEEVSLEDLIKEAPNLKEMLK